MGVLLKVLSNISVSLISSIISGAFWGVVLGPMVDAKAQRQSLLYPFLDTQDKQAGLSLTSPPGPISKTALFVKSCSPIFALDTARVKNYLAAYHIKFST